MCYIIAPLVGLGDEELPAPFRAFAADIAAASMAPPFGLTLYNLRPRRGIELDLSRPARPNGALIWLHAPCAEAAKGLMELASRLIEEEGLAVLLTCVEPLPTRPNVIFQAPPSDDPQSARAFLDHWRPAAAVFTEGELRPAILHEAKHRSIALILADAKKPILMPEREGWYPGLMRAALHCFEQILAIDDAAARAFRKAGASASAVKITGRLEEESAALPCLEAERANLAQLLASRPVWLAAGLPEAEEAAVIAAHRTAQSGAHRLLLIIAPQDPARAPALAAKLSEEEGLITACRDAEEEPEPDVEVFITDGQTEMGLWYRLAPVSFMGGSLTGNGSLRNPMEAAALGSAILYGTRPGPYAPVFGRLGTARAARAVGTPSDLSDALIDLLAPDKAARLAQAAWIVASDGAEVTENLVTSLRHFLEG